MCTAEQYRATATEYKERADQATAPDEKRAFHDLERSFTTLADNEQWLSNNRDKTVHAIERLSAASVPTMRYLLRTRGNSTDPHSSLKAAKS
jgi:ABC-type Zn uptake system ZnuABC Zn-binding protein ZnuA